MMSLGNEVFLVVYFVIFDSFLRDVVGYAVPCGNSSVEGRFFKFCCAMCGNNQFSGGVPSGVCFGNIVGVFFVKIWCTVVC